MTIRPGSIPAERWFWSTSWFVLITVSLLLRPAYPLDETRYLAVAWEMWRDGNFLLPHLNAEPYADKPPLLFWLWHAGWSLAGVNEWWPRLLTSAFMGGAAYCLHRIAKILWPQDDRLHDLAPTVFAGCVYVALFTQMLMFDSMVVFFTLASWWALLSERYPGLKAGIATSLGLLGKGPIILIYVLPLLLMMPVLRSKRVRTLCVYILVSLTAPVAWLVSLHLLGHEEFVLSVLFDQILSRTDGSVGHDRPWWWYLPLLFPVLLPWIALPSFWRKPEFDSAASATVAALAVMLFVLSIVGNKQMHYLLPLIAVASIPIALQINRPTSPLSRLLLPIAAFALLLLLLTLAVRGTSDVKADPVVGWPILLFAGMLLLSRIFIAPERRQSPVWLAVGSVAFSITLLMLLAPVVNVTHDLRPAAARLALAEQLARPIAWVGNYEGQLVFHARLQKPLQEIAIEDAQDWQLKNPRGLLLMRLPDAGSASGTVVFSQPYRSDRLLMYALEP